MYIVFLDDPTPAPRALVGGKGESLMALVRAGFEVPDGFVVTTEAFREALRGRLAGARSAEDVRRRIVEMPLPEELSSAVERGYTELLQRGSRSLAVRSSSEDEDNVLQSWAGQQDSYIHVRGFLALQKHIKLCWASIFGDSALTYQAREGFLASDPAMAVVVQTMIDADIAGVSFSLNPINGRHDQVVHTSCYGLGETVVDGGAVDTFVVEKASARVIERRIGDKGTMRVPGQDSGTVTEEVPDGLAHRASLDEAQLTELTRLAARVERAFGRPQDLEWAYEGGRLYVLQARPVTAGKGVQRASDDDGAGAVWTNANVGEALPGVGTPFTWSIIGRFAGMGFEHAFGALGLDLPRGTLVRSFFGRVYLNQTALLEALSQIPFFDPERLLQLAGGTGQQEVRYERRSSLPFLARLPLTVPRIAFNQLRVPMMAPLSNRKTRFRMRRISAELQTLPERARLAALTESFTEEVFNPTGTLMLAAASNALSSYIGTSFLLDIMSGGDLAGVEKRLFSGLSRLKSAQPGLMLLRLARVVRNQRDLRRLFQSDLDADAVVACVREEPRFKEFRREFEGFLEAHGYRAPREAEIATPRWEDRPGAVVDMLRAYLQVGEPPDPIEFIRERVRERRRAERDAKKRLGSVGRLVLGVVLPWARDASRLREELRDVVVHTISVYRQLGLAAGRHLQEDGLVAQAEDAFMLTYDEVLAYLRGEIEADLSYRIALRKGQFELFERMPSPPPAFREVGGEIIMGEQEELPEGDALSGVGGSPGRVTGRARVMRGVEEMGRLDYGDVLVTTQTDVGWTPLFLVAGAVVTEMGGPLSHSCVVAREYGKPAVVNVPGATRLIEDGRVVTVDGDRGEVILH